MKKIYKTMLALMAGVLVLSACKNDDVILGEQDSVSAQYVELLAVQEGGDTRAAIGTVTDKTTEINWTTGDKINYFGAQSGQFLEYTGKEASTSVMFTGTVTKGSTDYVLYPYQEGAVLTDGVITVHVPMTQKAVVGSFDPSAAIMLAKVPASGSKVQFKNVMSYIKVKVPKDCYQVAIKAHKAWTTVSGTVQIRANKLEEWNDSPDNIWQETPEALGQALVRLVKDPADLTQKLEAGTYYIAVLPQILTDGFEVIYNINNNIYIKAPKSLKPLHKIFSRNKVKDIGELKAEKDSVTDPIEPIEGDDIWIASRNIGATKDCVSSDLVDDPDTFGDYFAWAALRPWYIGHGVWYKDNYSKAKAPYFVGNIETGYYVKYGEGATPPKMDLDPEDDAAVVLWGGNWRMPTITEFTDNREIFGSILPHAGYYNSTVVNHSLNYYWSTKAYEEEKARTFRTDTENPSNQNRYIGLPIRPVMTKPIE